MKTIFNENLPDGYRFVSREDIDPSKIIELRESVSWDKGGTLDEWADYVDNSLAAVCVYDFNDELAGVAFLVGNTRHAVLCDLTVRLDHQHKGIGGAIMAELMRQIELLNISYVYTELADTNPFREKMIQAGFKVTGNSLFLES